MKRDELIVSEWVSAENQIFESWISWGVGDVVALSAMTMAFFSLRPAVLCDCDMFVFVWACVCVCACVLFEHRSMRLVYGGPRYDSCLLWSSTQLAGVIDFMSLHPCAQPAAAHRDVPPRVCVCACTRICVCAFLNLKQSLVFKEPPFFIVNCPCLLIYATEEKMSNLWLFICLFPFRFSQFFFHPTVLSFLSHCCFSLM